MNSNENNHRQPAVPKAAAAFAPQILEVLETEAAKAPPTLEVLKTEAATASPTLEVLETEAATALPTLEILKTEAVNISQSPEVLEIESSMPPTVGAAETILAPAFDPADSGTIRLSEISATNAQKSSGKLAAWQVWGLRVVLFLPLIAIVLTIFGIPTAIVRTIDSWLNPAPPLVPPSSSVETAQPQPTDNVKKTKSSRSSGTGKK
jgi:hypothetical protein